MRQFGQMRLVGPAGAQHLHGPDEGAVLLRRQDDTPPAHAVGDIEGPADRVERMHRRREFQRATGAHRIDQEFGEFVRALADFGGRQPPDDKM
jgi:hypothetical protein